MERHESVWCVAVLLLGASSTQCQSEPVVLNLTGHPGEGYSLEIEIGTPPQQRRVIMDTESSNFAVPFISFASKTYNDLGNKSYFYDGRSYWSGNLCNDTLTISPLQPLTVKLFHTKFSYWGSLQGVGLLGLAYPSIAKEVHHHRTSPPSIGETPVFDSLVQTGTVSSNTFSMQLCGTSNKGPRRNISTGGKFVLDGLAKSLYTGDILYTPIQRTGFYEVALSRVEVDGESLGFDCIEYNTPYTIVASATAALTFPDKIYDKVITKVHNYAKVRIGNEFNCISDKSDELFRIQSLPYETPVVQSCCIAQSQTDTFFRGFPTISLALPLNNASNREFVISIPPQLYLQPAAGGNPDQDCYQLLISRTGPGIDDQGGTILGSVVMEGRYVVFDRENRRIGFANSTCGAHDPALQQPDVVGPSPAANSRGCLYVVDIPAVPVSAGAVLGIILSLSVAIGAVVAVVAVKLYRHAKRRSPGEAESGTQVAESRHRLGQVASDELSDMAPVHVATLPSTLPDTSAGGEDDQEEASDSVALLSDF